jgi:hypothetical protein
MAVYYPSDFQTATVISEIFRRKIEACAGRREKIKNAPRIAP